MAQRSEELTEQEPSLEVLSVEVYDKTEGVIAIGEDDLGSVLGKIHETRWMNLGLTHHNISFPVFRNRIIDQLKNGKRRAIFQYQFSMLADTESVFVSAIGETDGKEKIYHIEIYPPEQGPIDQNQKLAIDTARENAVLERIVEINLKLDRSREILKIVFGKLGEILGNLFENEPLFYDNSQSISTSLRSWARRMPDRISRLSGRQEVKVEDIIIHLSKQFENKNSAKVAEIGNFEIFMEIITWQKEKPRIIFSIKRRGEFKYYSGRTIPILKKDKEAADLISRKIEEAFEVD